MWNDFPGERRASTSPADTPIDELDEATVRMRLTYLRSRGWLGTRIVRLFAYAILATIGFFLLLEAGYLRPQPSTMRPPNTGLGGGQVTIAAPAFCGNPLTVFQHFGLADKAGHVGLVDGSGNVQQPIALPGGSALSKLPKQLDPTATNPISYDPTTNTLCATSYVALYTRYVKPQPTVNGSNNYDPNYGFTNQTVSNATNTLNPANWVQSALQGIIVNVTHGFYDLLINLRDQLTSLGFLYSTPPPLTYGNDIVKTGFAWSLLALDAAAGLMVVMAGYNLMMHRHLDIPASELFQSAPKFILALAAAHASLFFIGPLIELMNTLTGDFTNTIGGGKILEQTQNWQTLTGVAGQLWQTIVTVIFSIIDLIFMLLLSLQMLLRIALLDILLIFAPFWVAAAALAQTRSFSQLGTSTFAATLIVQLLQVADVDVGAALAANVLKGSPIIGLLVSLASFYLAFKIPGMISNGLRGSVGAVHRDLLVLGSAITGAQAAQAAAAGGIPPELWVL